MRGQIPCASTAPRLGCTVARGAHRQLHARAPPYGRQSGRRRSTSAASRFAGAQPGGGRETRCAGTVREIAYMGDMSIYLVQIDSGRMMRVTLPNVMRAAERPDRARGRACGSPGTGSSPVVLTE